MVNDSTLDPSFDIEVDNAPVGYGILSLIDRVEYESADGLADVATLTMTNPDSIISNAKAFQPGKEMSIFMGYGGKANLEHIGRVEIIRNQPNFPQSGQPTLRVVGYTRDAGMMENAPKQKENKKKRKSNDRIFKDSKISDVVEKIAKDVYGFETEVDITTDKPNDIHQNVGMNDYEFIKGLANQIGYTFWVDGDQFGVWTLHFKDPFFIDQEKEYTFKYGQDGAGTLLSFTPELLIKGSYTRLRATVKDTRTGKLLEVEVEENNQKAPDVLGVLTEAIQEESSTASDIRIFFNSYSFKEVSDRRFKTEEELEIWAQQWFRRHRENFILSRATSIGVENIMARQIHNIDGAGSLYNGAYYFNKVKHIMDKSSGYSLNIAMRKQTPK